MDLKYLQKLLNMFDESKTTELSIEEEGLKLFLSKENNNSSDLEQIRHFINTQPMMQAPFHFQQPAQQAPYAIANLAEDSKAEHTKNETAQEPPIELLHNINSPIVGTFYRAPSPDSPTFVEIGSHVNSGSVLCIVEAMKLMNEIESDVTGTIVKILVENAQPVEYNQPMFIIKPD